MIIESLLDAGYKIEGYFDFKAAGNDPYCLEYLGFEKEIDVKSTVGNSLVFPAIGDTTLRRNLILFFEQQHLNEFTAIDPSANISRTAFINKSTYIGKNVILNAHAKIGKGVILNSGCIIEHECKISDFVHIAPGAVLCGNVSVGKESFVGANAVVKQNMSIGENIIIGAGSVITSDVKECGTWVGNKLRKL